MSLSKVIVFLIIIVTCLTVFGFQNNYGMVFAFGHILMMPLIGIWYGYRRKWQFGPVDKLIYLSYFIGLFADSLILIDWGTFSEFLQINATFIMHFVFIMAFRQEGTLVYTTKFKEAPKIVFPVVIVILAFSLFVVPLVTDSLYFILIFYSVLEIILMTHGYFRPIKGKSYFWVALGVTFIFLKDVVYCVHFFVFERAHTQLYMLQLVINVIAYFMVALGMSISQNNNEDKYEKVSLRAIINSIKDLSLSSKKENSTTTLYEFLSRN